MDAHQLLTHHHVYEDNSGDMVLALFVVLALVFWGYMLVDVIKTRKGMNKAVWLLVVLLLGLLGAAIYFFFGRQKPSTA